MTSGKAKEKWRPSLAMIVFAVLAAVAVLPLVGLFFFRLYDNQLIRQTQAELIAQSQVFATIFAREVEARRASGIALGAEIRFRPDPIRTINSRRSGPSSTLPPTNCCGDGPRPVPRKCRPTPPLSRSAQD